MSFVKEIAASAETMVEAGVAPKVVETISDQQEGHEASGALALVQDLRLNVVIEVPQQDIRPDMIE